MSEDQVRELADKELATRRERFAKEHEGDAASALLAELGKAAKVNDPDTVRDIAALGFTPETVPVLPLVPLVAVGWADGTVSTHESERILELAQQRGAAKDSPAYDLLAELLTKQPEPGYVCAVLSVLRHVYEALDPSVRQRAKRNLIGYSLVVARASGGLLGLFGNKVSKEERSLLETLTEYLGVKAEDEDDEPAAPAAPAPVADAPLAPAAAEAPEPVEPPVAEPAAATAADASDDATKS